MDLDFDGLPAPMPAPVETTSATAPCSRPSGGAVPPAAYPVLASLPPIGQTAFEQAGLSVVAFYREVIARHFASAPAPGAGRRHAAGGSGRDDTSCDTGDGTHRRTLVANHMAPAPAPIAAAPLRSALRNAPVFTRPLPYRKANTSILRLTCCRSRRFSRPP